MALALNNPQNMPFNKETKPIQSFKLFSKSSPANMFQWLLKTKEVFVVNCDIAVTEFKMIQIYGEVLVANCDIAVTKFRMIQIYGEVLVANCEIAVTEFKMIQIYGEVLVANCEIAVTEFKMIQSLWGSPCGELWHCSNRVQTLLMLFNSFSE